MNAARWERIQALFHRAADLAEPARGEFLNAECGADAGLLGEVLALLAEDARGVPVLDGDPAALARDILDGDGPAPLPREPFGPYRVTRLLGEGGMGVVYLAEREDLGSVAAIKILRDAWLSPARRDRFASEQRTLAQLNHPSIAHLYDADTLPDGTPWFVMEYVEGVPVTLYCSEHGLDMPERLELFRAVCEAVQHAHRHAVIHRDLKPSNILVKAGRLVKLLDFGISKQIESLEMAAERTQTGLRFMTPAYAAPEQIRGERVGTHTDIYSLGVILYELIAGRMPYDFSNLTPAEAGTLIVETQPDRPSAAARRGAAATAASSGKGRPESPAPRAGGISRASWAELDVLCLTAMHKDPTRRYRTVEALIRDLDHYRLGEPLETRPDSWSYRTGKFLRRNWRAASLAALTTAALAALTIFYTARLAIARNEALDEAARTQRIQRFMLNLFEGDDEAAGPAADLRVVTLVERGVQEARSLDADPAVQAELYMTLGGIFEKLGRFDQAAPLFDSALAQRRTVFGPDSAEVAESLEALALLRLDQAEYEEADRLARAALEMSGRHHPAGHPAIARATATLGRVLEDRGLYDEAIPFLEEAVRLQSGPDAAPSDLAVSLTELANCHFYAGRYELSESLNQRVLELDRRIYGEHHPHVADDLINLGAIEFETGHYDRAEKYDRQALGIIRDFYGKDHPETASALTAVGRVLVQAGQAEEAGLLLQEALGVQERVYGPVHPRVASALNELGNVALNQGEFDDAEAAFRRMAAIYRSVYGDSHHLIGVALANLASTYLAKGENAKAESLLREVLLQYDRSLPPEHLNFGIARSKLGRALARQGRWDEAEKELLAAIAIYQKQPDIPAKWLLTARRELLGAYEAAKQTGKAAAIRAEIGPAG